MADLEVVGVQILEYADRITVIVGKLSEASANAHLAADLLSGESTGVYQGRAFAEMQLFVDSYAANVDKLISFESFAQTFLGQVFTECGFTDEELAAVVTKWLGGG